MTEKIKGKVKFFNDEKGFGFIIDAAGKEYFFHFTEIIMDGRKLLYQDDVVEFSPAASHKGPVAQKVTRVIEKL